MRIASLSTFDYPSRFAHAIHGLEMSRAFSRVFGNDFRFVCNTVVDGSELSEVRYVRLFGPFGRVVKKLRLRSVLFLPSTFVYLLFFRPTVIYTTEPGLYRYATILGFLFRARTILECHGSLTSGQAHALSHANAILFVTEGLRMNFLERAPRARARSFVVPNAVDVSRFDAVTTSSSELRVALALPQGRFLIGYIGRFEPLGLDKGLRLMIDSISRFSLDTDLVLVGAAKQEAEEYKAYAESSGMGSRVHIVPHVDPREVPRFAKACDLLCYVPPSNTFTETETSPMKLFEYMAAERPIIVSDTKAMHEILREDEAYFIVPGDDGAFVDAVTKVRSEAEESRDRARRAHTRVSSMTWSRRVERIVQFARSVV